MIDNTLFAAPTALDRNLHRNKRLAPRGVRFDRTAAMNAIFVAAVEFIDASREYPIVFIEAGQGADGKREVAPMAVLGLAPGENLMLQADGNWHARYVPALLRGYPLGIARTDDTNYVVVIDDKADALSDAEGERLFDDAGAPTPMLEERRKFLEQLEAEAQRTRMFGRTLLEAGLLQPMEFNATMPDGAALKVDGFLALDEKKFAELPPAKLEQLHKSGVLPLLYAHQFSLGLMRALVEKRAAREPARA
jgi:SapC